jgi:hypothetical protein
MIPAARAVAIGVVIGLAVAVSAATPALADEASEDEPHGLDLTIAAREIYDDNLYRLPATIDPTELLGPEATRDDYIQRVSLGLDQHWQWSRQQVIIDLLASNSRYQYNDTLDNTSGHGRAEWKWFASSAWSGSVGGDYSQSLASFANTRFLAKDMLETTGTFANMAFRFGPSWEFKTGARRSTSEHSASTRQFDNARTDSATAGLSYTTSSESEIGVSLRRTKADFDSVLNLAGQLFDRDYEDESLNLEFHRVVSPRTNIEASVGYLYRDYRDAALADAGKGNFDGPIGELLLEWQASNKIAITLNGWHKLKAYLDAESDYFVAQGGSIASTWKPRRKISVALEAGYETQDYLGTSINLTSNRRQDQVRSAELSVSYSPLRKLHFDLNGRAEIRDSDRSFLAYDSRVVSFGVRWTY